MTERGPNRLETVTFAVLATLALALLGVFVALLAGLVPVAEPGGTAEEAPAAAVTTAAATTTTTTSAATTADPEQEENAAERPDAPAAPAVARAAVVRVVASRGDCWVVARRGGPDGEVLHEALLPAGERITLRAARVWLQLGAAANVDVVVDGDPVAIGAGTLELVLPATDAAS